MHFTKMHGLGNDFVVLDATTQPINWQALPIAHLANRHLGIGFDQLLVITTPSARADFACLIFNADGSSAEQCGNGMRCIARFIHENQLTTQSFFTLETPAGLIPVTIAEPYEKIMVQMGVPTFTTPALQTMPLQHTLLPAQFVQLSMGNPHAILKVDTIKNFPVNDLGAKIAALDLFPEGVNVGFMEVVAKDHIRLRTFERGAGETYACGSNACAAVAAGIRDYGLAKKVTVELALGSLWIEWEEEKQPITMTGPAVKVFEGLFKF